MGKVLEYQCINCGIHCKKTNTAGKYCSNKCQIEYQYKQTILDWKSGIGTIGKVTVKRYLTERDGNKCSVCSIDVWNNAPIVFEIDHIDGDAYNNTEYNLRLICPNCHSQTPTYKNRNKGNGRVLNPNKSWLLEKQKTD